MPQGFNEIMAKIMPIILQVELEKQRQDRYLKNQLTEYEAYGETQRKLKEQELSNDIIGQLARTGTEWSKGQPYSMSAFVEGLRGLLAPNLLASLPVVQQQPPATLKLTEEARAALVRILAAQARRVEPDPADLTGKSVV